jgi:hypothetical protein
LIFAFEYFQLQEWEKMIRNDVEKMKADINWANLKRIMEKNNVTCEVFDTKRLRKKVFKHITKEKKDILSFTLTVYFLGEL